jgi:hypothetical protein
MKKSIYIIVVLVIIAVSVVGCTVDSPAYVQQPVKVQVINPDTTITGVGIEDARLGVMAKDYFVGVAEGEIAGHTAYGKIGYNAAVGTTEEDIWGASSLYVFPTASQGMEVRSSDNTNDKAGGTGALTVRIDYLKSDYSTNFEVVTLNGTTNVNTTNTDIFRINNFRVLTTGTSGKSAGVIDVRNKTDHTTIYSRILINGTRARNSIFTVPIGKTLYINDFYAGVGGMAVDDMCRITLRATYNDVTGSLLTPGIFFMPYIENIQSNGSITRHFTIPIKIIAQSDIKVSAYADKVSAAIETDYRGWLE